MTEHSKKEIVEFIGVIRKRGSGSHSAMLTIPMVIMKAYDLKWKTIVKVKLEILDLALP